MKFKQQLITPDGCKFIRGCLEITQKQLGDIIGVTKMTISNFETGKQSAPIIAISYTMRDLLSNSDINDLLKMELLNSCFYEKEIEI